jgi:hypothetical protein
VVDAKIEDKTSPRRQLAGKWTPGAQTGDFKAVRDNRLFERGRVVRIVLRGYFREEVNLCAIC